MKNNVELTTDDVCALQDCAVLLDLIAKGRFASKREEALRAVISDLKSLQISSKIVNYPELDKEILATVKDKNNAGFERVRAVKKCKEITGWGLKECCEYVDSWAVKNGIGKWRKGY